MYTSSSSGNGAHTRAVPYYINDSSHHWAVIKLLYSVYVDLYLQV